MASSIFSFFSGAGFLDLGFELTEGFDVVFANEIDPNFARAYRESRRAMHLPFPTYGVHECSIEHFKKREAATMLNNLITQERQENPNNFIGMIGGPPCPDFSVGGKNRGHEGDNGRLSKDYVDMIINNAPDWFLFENVKGLWKTKKHRAFYEEQKKRLHRRGYITAERLINSIEYGVPQDRYRIILIGFHANEFPLLTEKSKKHEIAKTEFPWDAHVNYDAGEVFSLDWPTINAFGDTPALNQNLPDQLTVQHWFDRNMVEDHPNTSDCFKPRQGLRRFLTVDEGDDSKKSYKRLHRYRFSPTAAYGNNEVHLHPYRARRINVAEALAIQSLPINFSLPQDMTLSAMFKVIGNGVPFLMAEGLAQTINEVIDNEKN